MSQANTPHHPLSLLVGCSHHSRLSHAVQVADQGTMEECRGDLSWDDGVGISVPWNNKPLVLNHNGTPGEEVERVFVVSICFAMRCRGELREVVPVWLQDENSALQPI